MGDVVNIPERLLDRRLGWVRRLKQGIRRSTVDWSDMSCAA